jgi:hypothetical protein
MERYAEANGIPWIRFSKGDRRIDVIRPYLEAAEPAGQPGVVAIAVTQEFQVQATYGASAAMIAWAQNNLSGHWVFLWLPGRRAA